MYTVDKKRETFERVGAWNQKKDAKRVGEEWRAAADDGDVKATYTLRFDAARAASAQQHAAWRLALAAWRVGKAAKVAASEEPADPDARREKGLNPICTCTHCTQDEAEEGDGAAK